MMDLRGEQLIEAPPERVWDALNDPTILQLCLPGCESMERVSDTSFNALMAVGIGPVKARFKGVIALTDLDPPHGYRLSGRGEGGVAGFAKGGAQVRLEAVAEGTLLHYEVDAQVGGKLAQVGNRLVMMAARKLARDFFKKFCGTLQEGTDGA